jgi:hypothetical protein
MSDPTANMPSTTDQKFDTWLRGQSRAASFTPTGNAAEDIQWLRRMSGFLYEPGPDVDGVYR